MECQNCKAEMKKMHQSTGWIQKHFYWCPECGTFCKKEFLGGTKDPISWYKPGYLFDFEQEGK